jgi:hypothetical protein
MRNLRFTFISFLLTLQLYVAHAEQFLGFQWTAARRIVQFPSQSPISKMDVQLVVCEQQSAQSILYRRTVECREKSAAAAEHMRPPPRSRWCGHPWVGWSFWRGP